MLMLLDMTEAAVLLAQIHVLLYFVLNQDVTIQSKKKVNVVLPALALKM
jgi:hypothetical protein